MLATSDAKPDAERFVRFLLSRDAQAYFADKLYEYPVAAGVAPPEGLPPLADLQGPSIRLADLGARARLDAEDARPGRPDVVTRRSATALGALALAVVALVSLPLVYLLIRIVDGGEPRLVGARAAGHARLGGDDRRHGRRR